MLTRVNKPLICSILNMIVKDKAPFNYIRETICKNTISDVYLSDKLPKGALRILH